MAIDVTQCQTVEFMLLDDRVQQLEDTLNANTDNGTRNLTVMFDVMEVQFVSEELSVITAASVGPILPNDLSTTNDILNTMIK